MSGESARDFALFLAWGGVGGLGGCGMVGVLGVVWGGLGWFGGIVVVVEAQLLARKGP